jgi:hypothetical protein
MERRVFVLGVAAVAIAPAMGDAQTVSVQDAIARLFTAPAVESTWFSSNFLAAVPLEKVRAILAAIVGTLGAFQTIAPNRSRYTLTFAGGTIQGEGSLDEAGAFAGLLFSRMQSAAAADRIAALFRTDPPPAAWFSDRMLDSVPIAKIGTVVTSMKTQYGAFKSATPSKDGTYDVEFVNGSANALIFLGPDGKIEGLIFQPH